MHELHPSRPVKRVAVIQSNYIPWVGYFAVMSAVDLFVVYECVQYTKNDWRNRNLIQTRDQKMTWLSIPVRHYSHQQLFMETTVARHDWAVSHFDTLRQHFSKTPGWVRWHIELEALYNEAAKLDYLYQINRIFMNWVVKQLGIKSEIVYLSDFPKYTNPTTRLIEVLKNFKATHYLSGPSAKNYIDPTIFCSAEIDLNYVNYDELVRNFVIGPEPVKSTSIIQLILESNHEFRHH